MLGRQMHLIVLFIKKQLAFTEHPIRQLIEKFKELFVDKNMALLCKQVDDGGDQ